MFIASWSGCVLHENLYLLWVPFPAGTHGVHEDTFLPASIQGFWLQISYSSEHPTQSCPSCGGGLLQYRDLCLMPPPHLAEHLPHGPQVLQPGSLTTGGETVNKKKGEKKSITTINGYLMIFVLLYYFYWTAENIIAEEIVHDHIPGQGGFEWQNISSVSRPTHTRPPNAGAGFPQVLFLTFTAEPQLCVQADQSDQLDHCPCTVQLVT